MSKEGISYFSFDTDFFHTDKKIRLLKGEFGAKGVAVLLYTLCVIYSDKGYYMHWGADDCYLMSEDMGCDGCDSKLIGEVINGCVRRGIFNEDVFNAFGVLTSHGIQMRFLKAAAKRERIKIIEEYALFDKNELTGGMCNKVTLLKLKDASCGEKVASYDKKVTSCDIKKESKERNNSCAPEPDQRTPEEAFEIIYGIYPKKKGKTKAYEYYLGWLKGRSINGKKIRLTNKQMYIAVRRYVRQCEADGTELQFYKNFDTLMNKQILDYVEEAEA